MELVLLKIITFEWVNIQRNHHGRQWREPEHKKQDLPKAQTLSKIKLDRFLTNRHEANEVVRERND